MLQDVTPLGGAPQREGAEGKDTRPSATAGIWKHVLDPASGKVKGIYFIRQLSNDERSRKVQRAISRKMFVVP